MSAAPRERWVGLGYGLLAYGLWAFAPLYWKLLRHVAPLEIVAHRVMWAAIVFTLLARWRRLSPARSLGDRSVWIAFLLSGGLLAINWGVFVYAVETDRVLHASLGYFINPIVSVFLGALVLRERLRRLQWFAVALAVCGVGQLALGRGGVPWISLVLAASFGSYGLARKLVPRGPLEGSTIEAWLMTPVAVAYVVSTIVTGTAHLDAPRDIALLVLTGPVTALPLLWFANAAKRLPLSTIGFLQYLAPTGQFVLAVVFFGEVFDALHLRSFATIWLGIAVFCVDAWRHRGRGPGSGPPMSTAGRAAGR